MAGVKAGAKGRALRMLLFPALLGAAAAGCGSGGTLPAAERLFSEDVDLVIYGMRTNVTREGIRRAVVEGDTAEFHEGNEIHIRPMRVVFYDGMGRQTTEVTSVYGVFDEVAGDLDATGSVVAVDLVLDQRLETEHLRYAYADDRLYGDMSFRLLRNAEGMVIEGSSFESDPALDSVIVFDPSGQTGRLVSSPDVPAAGDDTASASPDSASAPGDSLQGAPGDTTATPDAESAAGDSASASPDSASAPPPDTASAPQDTVSAPPPDTASAPPDTASAPPDTASAPPDP